VLLVCIGFGAGTTALSVSQDLAGGMIDRLRSIDVRGETLINGHVIASVLRNLLSTAIVLGVALAIGSAVDARHLVVGAVNGGSYLVQSLAGEGVDHVFMVLCGMNDPHAEPDRVSEMGGGSWSGWTVAGWVDEVLRSSAAAREDGEDFRLKDVA
jgi:hypothetical protein